MICGVQSGGVRGLWAGWTANVQRAALVTAGDIVTYDAVKRRLIGGFKLKVCLSQLPGEQWCNRPVRMIFVFTPWQVFVLVLQVQYWEHQLMSSERD